MLTSNQYKKKMLTNNQYKKNMLTSNHVLQIWIIIIDMHNTHHNVEGEIIEGQQ